MENIIFVAYYGLAEMKDQRKFVLAAKNKSDYIFKAIEKNEYSLLILSASGVRGKVHASSCKIPIFENTILRLFSSIGDNTIIKRIVDRNVIKAKILTYLLLHTNSSTKVCVYHSLNYMGIISLTHKLKKYKLFLEVEEIYSDVIGNKKMRCKELKFIQSADSYIFPTQLLDESLNQKHKPSIFIHGTYQVEPDRKCNIFLANSRTNISRTIHCVYAGTFDPRKGGTIAAASAEFLPSNYHIHILGFGNKSDTQNMMDTISNITGKSQAKVTYDGLLSGEDYIRFIQSCDIGLSTQNPDEAFNATSFPSKILSYMANGLRVVSIRIPAIETSAIGGYMYYYDKQTPEEIAKTIMQIDFNDNYDGRKIISQLDLQFQKDLKWVLEDM